MDASGVNLSGLQLVKTGGLSHLTWQHTSEQGLDRQTGKRSIFVRRSPSCQFHPKLWAKESPQGLGVALGSTLQFQKFHLRFPEAFGANEAWGFGAGRSHGFQASARPNFGGFSRRLKGGHVGSSSKSSKRGTRNLVFEGAGRALVTAGLRWSCALFARGQKSLRVVKSALL